MKTWKLVPVEYTIEQMLAAHKAAKENKPRANDRDVKAHAFDLCTGYRVMVEAAPPAPIAPELEALVKVFEASPGAWFAPGWDGHRIATLLRGQEPAAIRNAALEEAVTICMRLAKSDTAGSVCASEIRKLMERSDEG